MGNPYALKIYIDGSYRPKTNVGGFAIVVHFPESANKDSEKISSLPFTPATINQMELEACTQALIYVQKNIKQFKLNHVEIYTDSNYVANGQHNCNQWNHDKWQNQYGAPIKNKNTWKLFMKELRKARESVPRVEIFKIAGKSTTETLEVDKLAKESSSKLGGRRFPEIQRTRVTKILGNDKRSAIKFPAKGQKIIARIYSDIVAGNLWEFRFQEIDESTLEPSRKYIAYTSHDNSPLIHRAHYYSIIFNNSEELPIADSISEIAKPTK